MYLMVSIRYIFIFIIIYQKIILKESPLSELILLGKHSKWMIGKLDFNYGILQAKKDLEA